MTAAASRELIRAVQVVIGVDTHQDQHVAIAIDQQGVRLAEHHVPDMGNWNGGPKTWERFAPLGSKAQVPTAPGWPDS